MPAWLPPTTSHSPVNPGGAYAKTTFGSDLLPTASDPAWSSGAVCLGLSRQVASSTFAWRGRDDEKQALVLLSPRASVREVTVAGRATLCKLPRLRLPRYVAGRSPR